MPTALRLQRLVGNRTVVDLLARDPAIGSGLGVSHVQRRREPNEDEGELLTAYNDSAAAGARMKTRLTNWLANNQDATPALATQDTTQAAAQAGYKTFWFERHGQIVVNTSRGERVADLPEGQVGGYRLSDRLSDDQDYFYSNSFDPTTGEFHASVNYRSVDQELALPAQQPDNWVPEDDEPYPGEGLPDSISNSEIIWYQRKIAADAWQELHPDEANPPTQIRSISREEVSNDQTLRTIALCDQGDDAQLEGEDAKMIRFNGVDAPDDGWALLGSPNGNSSVWLLMQHGVEAGLTGIESVTYSEDRLLIRFTTA
jgi:hypothetical protein